jgi:hypothetical protein
MPYLICLGSTPVGHPYRLKQVNVSIVANSVEISPDGQVLMTHPSRHARSKEFVGPAAPSAARFSTCLTVKWGQS